MSDSLSAKVREASELIEELSDEEKISLLKTIFGQVEIDNAGQYIVYTEILQSDVEPVDPFDVSDFLYDDEEDEEISEYVANEDISKKYRTFVCDMVRAGFKANLRLKYGGRWHYNGPACTTSREARNDDSVPVSAQDIIRATKVNLLSDSMGLDMIYYPG